MGTGPPKRAAAARPLPCPRQSATKTPVTSSSTPPRPLTGQLPSEAHTAALAAALAAVVAPGDVLLLNGTLGAGKSAFARAMIQSAQTAAGMVAEDVPSPSYTLVQSYEAGARGFVHADLYRLGDPGELAELGLDEALEQAVCLIEWPDRLGEATPVRALSLTFVPCDLDEGARHVTLTPSGAGWDTVLTAAKEVLT